MNNYSKEKLRRLLEKALYFYVWNCSQEELEEQAKFYNIWDSEHFKCDLEEDLVDIMFESYLENYEGKELLDRINNLFYLDNLSDSEKLEKYKNFLEKENRFNEWDIKIEVK